MTKVGKEDVACVYTEAQRLAVLRDERVKHSKYLSRIVCSFNAVMYAAVGVALMIAIIAMTLGALVALFVLAIICFAGAWYFSIEQ